MSSTSPVDVAKTPQFLKLDALEKSLAKGALIDTSLNPVTGCSWMGFLIRWIANPLARLLGCDLLSCYKVKNVATSLLEYCKKNAEAFKQHDVLHTKVYTILSSLDDKTKGKYKADVSKAQEGIGSLQKPSQSSDSSEPVLNGNADDANSENTTSLSADGTPGTGATGGIAASDVLVGGTTTAGGAASTAGGPVEQSIVAGIVSAIASRLSGNSSPNPADAEAPAAPATPAVPATPAAAATSGVPESQKPAEASAATGADAAAATGEAENVQEPPKVTVEEVSAALVKTFHSVNDEMQKVVFKPGKSVAYSNTALVDMLGLLMRGAKGEELDAYKKIFSLASETLVDQELKKARDLHKKAGISEVLCFANGSKAVIDQSFAKSAKEMFGAEIFETTRRVMQTSARNKANDHIAKNTGKAPINGLLPDEFKDGKGVEFALVQATSIQATLPCAITKQEEAEFTCTNEEKKKTKLATLETTAKVHEAKDYTLVEVSYKTGGEAPLSKVLVLPKDPKAVYTLTTRALEAARKAAVEKEVTLVMPQMDFESKEFKAQDALKTLGFPAAKVLETPLSGVMTACRLQEVDGPKQEGPAPEQVTARTEYRFDRSFGFFVCQGDTPVLQGLVDDEKALPKA